jgi:hypothetical protein
MFAAKAIPTNRPTSSTSKNSTDKANARASDGTLFHGPASATPENFHQPNDAVTSKRFVNSFSTVPFNNTSNPNPMPLPTVVSDDFRRLNPHLYNVPHIPSQSTGENPVPQRRSRNGSLAKGKDEKGDTAKFFVRIVSYRRRLLDEDNIVGKWHTDMARYCGILPSDAPGQTRIITTQEKIDSKDQEYTLIEIDREALP